MKYRVIGNTGLEASILGLGCMRLPVEGEDASKIKKEEAIEMIRYAIDNGINYIDTAYPYHGGESERIVGEALKDGYREKAILITKSPGWMIKTQADFHKYLDEQLEKLGTDHLDIYLLHALNKNTWATYKEIDVFTAIEEAKAKGKIKHIGFSFHDEFEVFEEIISAYNWELCMLQLNFMDMGEQAGLRGLKLAEEKGIPVIVMEPLKGGMLANPSDEVNQIWNSYPEKRSAVEWALRYVANFNNVKVVLSGMSSLDQIKNSLSISDQLTVGNLDARGLEVVEKVKNAYASRVQVPCTDCKYCVPCPQGVQIPRAFTFYNRAHIFNQIDAVKGQYNSQVPAEAKAGQCIECGLCEPKCPQKIQIIDSLKRVALAFE